MPVGNEQPHRTEEARARGDDDATDAQLLRHSHRMCRACPTERHEGEVARVPSSFGAHGAYGACHCRADDGVDTKRSLEGRQPERLRHAGLNRLGCSIGVDGLRTACESLGAVIAEHDIRIRDRRPRPTAIVTSRPRYGPRALGADMGYAAAVDPDEAPAAGPNFGDVE